ncbi:MAG: helix-hairpin-helix domain-containing protein [Candidatus Eremiobacteraeota bacterium]|nr:helix-hairpin-helix domain-containing protein [Candidatus Eremiobacteraeota bacterium]
MNTNESKTQSDQGNDNRLHRLFFIISILFFVFSISLYLYVFFAPEPVTVVGAEMNELIDSELLSTPGRDTGTIKHPTDTVQSTENTGITQPLQSPPATLPTQYKPFVVKSPEMKIKINFADIEEIAKLPGIGPKKAANIINYRKRHGSFTKKKDIMSVPGIGEKIYENIKDKIVLW